MSGEQFHHLILLLSGRGVRYCGIGLHGVRNRVDCAYAWLAECQRSHCDEWKQLQRESGFMLTPFSHFHLSNTSSLRDDVRLGRSIERQAPVNPDLRAQQEARIGRREIKDRLGHLFRRAQALERHHPRHGLA